MKKLPPFFSMSELPMELKRQNLPTGLWVIATPIGNLEDLSKRAITALKQAEILLCEDTRRTTELLSALEFDGFLHKGKRPKLERLDAHTKPSEFTQWSQALKTGKKIGLVTDAGTPGISDPGAAFIKHCHDSEIVVSPVPGVSALTAFLSVSGFIETRFTFQGFFPRKIPQDFSQTLTPGIHVWFESPERITETLQYILETFPEEKISIAKELTKVFEYIWSGEVSETIPEVFSIFESDPNVMKGEWVVGLCVKEPTTTPEKSLDWVKTLECLKNCGVSATVAAKEVSQSFGASKNEAYEAYLNLKKIKKE